MPLYDYRCTQCGVQTELITRMDDFGPPCPYCGKPMKREVTSRVNINMGVGAYGYYDENLGTYINTNEQKRKVMEEQGVNPKGDTPKTGKAWV